MKIRCSFSGDMIQTLEKNTLYHNVEESLKILDPDRDADDFQNLFSSFLSTESDVCGKVFTKIRSVVFT